MLPVPRFVKSLAVESPIETLSDKGQLKCLAGRSEVEGNLEQSGELHREAKALIDKDCHTSFSNISG